MDIVCKKYVLTMATGEDKSQTLHGGHETFFDFSCTLCGEEGKHIEAVQYCKECLVYMCDPCVQNHNRFPLNKRHMTLGQGRFVEVANTAPLLSFPIKRCATHPGELINIFCGGHNVVCCSVCKALEHSSCVGIQHIPDAAKGIQASPEFACTKEELNAFVSDVNAVLLGRKSDISRVAEDKKEVKKIIADFRRKVDEYFENLERKALDEMTEQEKMIVDDIDRDIRYLNTMKTEAEETLAQLESFQSQNESELFVYVKEGKQLLNDGKKRVRGISKTLHKQSIHFEISSNIEKYLQSLDTLGLFSDTGVSPQAVSSLQTLTENSCEENNKYNVQLFGRFNVTEASDVETSSISDICLLSDNTVLMIDGSNCKLKRLNQSYKVIDSVKLPEDCHKVCSVCPGKAAVTLVFTREVQFVSVQKKMLLTKSFSVGNECWGIACIDDKLYVCCSNDESGPGYIQVYTNNGELLFFIALKPQSEHFPPIARTISSSVDGHYYFITSCQSSDITMLDLAGNDINTFSHDMMDTPEGMCTNDKGQLFICDSSNNTIVLFSPKQQKLEVILKESDGIKDPQRVCYDQSQSRLVIGCRGTDELIVFSL